MNTMEQVPVSNSQVMSQHKVVIASTPGCEFCEILKRVCGTCQEKALLSASRAKMTMITYWKKLRLADLGRTIDDKMKNAPHLHIDELYALYKEAIELCDNDDLLAGMMLDLCKDKHLLLKGCGHISKI